MIKITRTKGNARKRANFESDWFNWPPMTSMTAVYFVIGYSIDSCLFILFLSQMTAAARMDYFWSWRRVKRPSHLVRSMPSRSSKRPRSRRREPKEPSPYGLTAPTMRCDCERETLKFTKVTYVQVQVHSPVCVLKWQEAMYFVHIWVLMNFFLRT